MALIPDFYLNSVVSIGVEGVDKQMSWIGTGFFIYRRINKTDGGPSKQVIPFLVTNKHVVESVRQIYIRLKKKNLNDLYCEKIDLIENGKKIYKIHDDPIIDIAVIPINGRYLEENNIFFNGFDIDENSMISSELRENGVDEGSLIYMLGFPMGLINKKSLLPICRLGCIARFNSDQVNDTKSFLADIQNFPGNSGSPIINRIEVNTLNGTKNLNRTVLIGIVHSYVPYQEQLINVQTKQIVEIRSENSGIALVHPIEYLKEIIDKFYQKKEKEANL